MLVFCLKILSPMRSSIDDPEARLIVHCIMLDHVCGDKSHSMLKPFSQWVSDPVRLCLIGWFLQAPGKSALPKSAAELTAQQLKAGTGGSEDDSEWELLPVDAELGVYRRRRGDADKLGQGAYGSVYRYSPCAFSSDYRTRCKYCHDSIIVGVVITVEGHHFAMCVSSNDGGNYGFSEINI